MLDLRGDGSDVHAARRADPLDLLTLDDLCSLLKVRRSWLYDAVETGAIPVVRLGRQLRFRRGDVATYLDALSAGRQ